MPKVKVTVSHINCREVTDTGIFGSNPDELRCEVSTGAGMMKRKILDVDLGNWNKGKNEYTDITLFNDDTDKYSFLPYLRFWFYDSDEGEPHFGGDDTIGILSLSHPKEGVISWAPEDHVAYKGDQSNPGAYDFEMTGSGSVYSIWLKVQMS